VAVTLVDYALTSLDAARVHLGRDADWTQDEQDKVSRMINSYSSTIRKYCDRQFAPAEDATAKRFRYEGSGYISLAPWELRSLAGPGSITLYTDLPQSGWYVVPDQDAVTESYYRLEPRQQTLEATYLWLVLPEIGMYSPLTPEPLVTRRARGHEVTIVGNWGIGSVPPDVEMACLVSIKNDIDNPGGHASRTIAGLSFTEVVEPQQNAAMDGLALPRKARSLLHDYKRSVYTN
jgi:hypothetical protein